MPDKKITAMMENGVQLSNEDLKAELFVKVLELNRYKLGGLVMDLLTKMGYVGRIGFPMYKQDAANWIPIALW